MLTPDNRVIMISGANRGIGLAVATKLAGEGYRLSLGARNKDALAAATRSLPQDRLLLSTWDAEDQTLTESWVAETVAEFGSIDGVVANAGVSIRVSLEGGAEEDYDKLWAVNFKGPLRLIRACMPHLRHCGHGRVVNVASLAGKRLIGDHLGYSASKFASVALSHAVRRVGWDDGIRATALCPGLVDTDMVSDRPAPEGEFKIEPAAIAQSVSYLLSLPNNASVAELLVNSRFEASI